MILYKIQRKRIKKNPDKINIYRVKYDISAYNVINNGSSA